ncbi:kielin/chordin-like protein [Tubulanus polymorphus]|uniref:kielin/chordin-like protein n=1 Tax=Tubulanus polymorphus TaxID=672921 RepID=UPI003DA1D3F4
MFLLALSVDRFIAIRKPLLARRLCSEEKAKKTAVGVMLVTSALCIPKFWDIRVYKRLHKCTGILFVTVKAYIVHNPTYALWYDVILTKVVLTTFPGLIILSCNLLMLDTIRKATSERTNLSNSTEKPDTKQGQQITKVIIVLATIYLVSALFDCYNTFSWFSPVLLKRSARLSVKMMHMTNNPRPLSQGASNRVAVLEADIRRLYEDVLNLKSENRQLHLRLYNLEQCACKNVTSSVLPKSCKFRLKEIKHGDELLDGCTRCICQNGRMRCEKDRNPNSNCHDVGACIHQGRQHDNGSIVETSCTKDGQDYKNGETWRSVCNECICRNGTVTCRGQQCPQVYCTHPVTPAGECCPVCDKDCNYLGQRWRHGDQVPNKGCQTCKCLESSITCRDISCEIPNCKDPVQLPGCFYGQIRRNGEVFKPDKCTVCRCVDGTVSCDGVTCTTNCYDPVTTNDECCPVCPRNLECNNRGRIYQDGEEFESVACERCVCQKGRIECNALVCPEVTCSRPVQPLGKCCPSCDVCDYDGQTFLTGEWFVPSYNPCMNCSCIGNLVKCTTIRCGPLPDDLPCSRPSRRLGECCPSVCYSCKDGEVERDDGTQWPSRVDPCKTCTCDKGRINCQTNRCPSFCRHGIKRPGSCCRDCSDCMYEGKVYGNYQTFNKTESDGQCSKCSCIQGNIQCRDTTCPILNCVLQDTPPESCCPVCSECYVEGLTYKDGELIPDGNPCTSCKCAKYGVVSCIEEKCPPLTCSHPVSERNTCCPSCSRCFYDEKIFENGKEFIDQRDHCLKCICKDGSVDCVSVDTECQPSCSHPSRISEQCCPVCNSCDYRGLAYLNGQEFRPDPSDLCRVCVCEVGSVRCSREECPETCSHPIKKEGACCPVCNGCDYLGSIYSHDQTFNPPHDDLCTTCTCKRGSVSCKTEQCITRCSHPLRMRDQCCPVCDGCEFERSFYLNGQRFRPDPCRKCACENGDVKCETEICISDCANPVQIEDQCCPVCEDCQYKGSRYLNNDVFRPKNDPCYVCNCLNGDVTCTSESCPPSRCSHPVQHFDGCCSVCDGCFYDSQQYLNGQVFRPNTDDLCNKCLCQDGNVFCEKETCDTKCTHPVDRPCCPECDGCKFDGNDYTTGESFNPFTNDPCALCTCQKGNVTCKQEECRTPCAYPIPPPSGACCPICAGCLYDDRIYMNDEIFKPNPSDPCMQCRCRRGDVTCDSVQCRAECSHPVDKRIDECCLTCDDCKYEGAIYENEQNFLPNADKPCFQCKCENGSVLCSNVLCDIECNSPVNVDGECCPQCKDCLHMGTRYSNLQTFYPESGNPCYECSCKFGNVECHQKACTEQCSHPGDHDECCPVCDRCNYEGKILIDGQKFRPNPNDSCYECVCQSGNVLCGPIECKTDCNNPVLIPGECCPVCDSCQYGDKYFRNGETIIPDRREPCNICKCQDGTLSCEMEICVVSCTHPVSSRGKCCPTCESCQFVDGKVYPNGGQFTPIDDKCDICLCRNGNVSCAKKVCEMNCTNPLPDRGQCCPNCSGCFYGERVYGNDDIIPSAPDECRICRCQGGNIICEKPECKNECSHPIPGKCCPSCEKCQLNDVIYENGERFQRPEDKCHMCECTGGTIKCWQEMCTQTCSHPVFDENKCCPVCDSCQFNDGQLIENSVEMRPDPDNDPCRVCKCKDGNLACEYEDCPSMCSDPVPKNSTCCPDCSKCLYNGIIRSNGETFRSKNDSCYSCICQDGSVTCTEETCVGGSVLCLERKCSENCSHPVHTDGQCCPECKRCSYRGLEFEDGEERVFDDVCKPCKCQSGSVVCNTIQCPQLNCERSVLMKGKCCRECLNVCISDGKQYDDGEMWISPLSNCLICTCLEGRSSCHPKKCPDLVCNEHERFQMLPNNCCGSCSSVSNQTCLHRGHRYTSASQWAADTCTNCSCKDGIVRCNFTQCPENICSSDETLTVAPGKCCPQCISRPGSCIAYGDPHYQSFDGRQFDFQGSCQYLMTGDCKNEDFRVEIQHDNRGTDISASWIQQLTLLIGNYRVVLSRDGTVFIGGEPVILPVVLQLIFSIEKQNDTLLVNTHIGLQIIWNGQQSHVEILVPGSYKSKLCGLCGNFNGFPQDDFRMRDGNVAHAPASFGNSWQVQGVSTNPSTCKAGEDVDPCKNAGFKGRRYAISKCAVLKNEEFRRCHRFVAPDSFYGACIYDMCVCMESTSCLCDVLSTYARECSKAGIQLNWRSPNLCATSCPESSGLIFDDCGPACPRTCSDRRLNPLSSNSTANCFKPCTPGCKCPAHLVLHQNRCITLDECPSDYF